MSIINIEIGLRSIIGQTPVVLFTFRFPCSENKKDKGEAWGVLVLPWYSVCCGGIVLHASSLLASPPSVCCDYRGMCCIKTTGRKRVLTANTKHSQPIGLLFVCYYVRRPDLCGLTVTSKEHLPRSTDTSGHNMTYNCGFESIFSSIAH